MNIIISPKASTLSLNSKIERDDLQMKNTLDPLITSLNLYSKEKFSVE